jgi:HEPN domain-containing protein
MNAQEKYEYWLEIAQYDLETADAMFSSGRWLYVLVMCQQAIEKLVKGLYTLYIDDNVPRIHNIKTLVKRFEDKLPVKVPDDKYHFFDVLTRYYLDNRYPDFISAIGVQTNETTAKMILSQTKETYSWLLTLKP